MGPGRCNWESIAGESRKLNIEAISIIVVRPPANICTNVSAKMPRENGESLPDLTAASNECHAG